MTDQQISGLIAVVRGEKNPIVVANNINYFLSDAMRENTISLYEGYLLNWEILRFRRFGYTNSGWGRKVRITICLELMNQKLLAHIFDEAVSAQRLEEWGLEAYRLNDERRPHYIMDNYLNYLNANNYPDLLFNLQKIREQYQQLSFDDGPYHNEVFPAHHYSPEAILLGQQELHIDKKLNEVIEELIYEINMR